MTVPPPDERPPDSGPIDTAVEVVRVEAPPTGEQQAVAAPAGSWRRPITLAVTAAVLGAFAVVASFEPGANAENRAYVDVALTDEVKAAASNALTTVSTYSWERIDEWPVRARAVLTAGMQQRFDGTVDATKAAAVQSETSTQGRVEEVGVSWLDAEHAEVLAYLTVEVDNGGGPVGSSSGTKLVRMQKVGDAWLMSEVVLQ